MPKGKRKHYTKEFKLSVVYSMLSKSQKPKDIFETHDNIDRQTAYRWLNEFKENGEKAFDSKTVLPGNEVERIKKQKADLEMENEILKKAIAYFAKTNTKD